MSAHGLGLGGGVDVVKRQIDSARLSNFDQLAGDSRGNGLPLLVEGNIALRHAKKRTKLGLCEVKPVSDCFEGDHETNISRPDCSRQQSDCLQGTSRAYIVCQMPAKELSPDQAADASRLKAAFKQWQADERNAGRQAAQDSTSDALGFGQSALSQYLNGNIPLNAVALRKFCALLRVSPATISPGIVQQERDRALAWLDADVPAPAPGTKTTAQRSGSGSQLHRTRDQKRSRAQKRTKAG